jgi:NAD(P)-dependent dehydrogenase (short-subunit alcohol dehydrogenase family)
MSRAWVIGGNSGIGKAIGDTLEERASAKVERTGPEVDVRDPLELTDFLSDHEFFDYVVFSAGIQKIEKLGHLSAAAFSIIDVNLMGFINVMDALAASQADHPTSIVAVVSDASRVAMRGSIAYCASKAGLAHAVRCAAREMAPAWIVNGVSPGIVDDTPMTEMIDAAVPGIRGWTPEQAREYETSMIPMARRAHKSEVAQAAYFALTGPAYMTGSIIEITGGK